MKKKTKKKNQLKTASDQMKTRLPGTSLMSACKPFNIFIVNYNEQKKNT
jgi:hypothetical protein